MQVYFSTVIRDAPPKEGGELVHLDWRSKQLQSKIPIYTTNPEINDHLAGSSTRGGRGIEVFADKIVVASYHTLQIYDRKLRHQKDISHPLMVGLHETFANSCDQLWVSCTTLDAALQIDLPTGSILKEIWPLESPKLQRALQRSPLEIDKNMDNRTQLVTADRAKSNRLHLNALAGWQGDLYALFPKCGAIVNLDQESIVIQDQALHGGHNLIIQPDGTAIVNGTQNRTIRFYDLNTASLVSIIDLGRFSAIRDLIRWHDLIYRGQRLLQRIGLYRHTPPRPLFIRGLSMLGDYLFVGISPASILCFDWRQKTLLDMYCYARDVRVCIHGLSVVDE